MPSRYSTKLNGQRLLVLGGSSGIGFATAEAVVEYGGLVILSGSKQDKVNTKVAELQQSYPEAKSRISGHACDLSDTKTQEEQIVRLLDYVTDNGMKKLDHVINTTGDGMYNTALADMTPENIAASQTVRVIGSLMLAKHAVNYVHKTPKSSLTFTTGNAGDRPPPGYTLTAMVCGYVDVMVRALAVNLALIRVNQVAPGATLTELWTGGTPLTEDKIDQVQKMMGGRTLTGLVGAADDVAEAFVYLMRDKNVTGQAIRSEGGALLR